MATCQMAGERCQRTQTVRVRIFGLGDRCICTIHLESLRRLGMDFRVLDDPEPAWKTNLVAKDMGYVA